MPRGVPARGPSGPAASAKERELLTQALARHLPDVPADIPGGSAPALLPILHHIQDALAFIPPALVPEIAAALNLSRAEVHGVVTYYHHFRSAPPGRHVVQICQAEACRANGAEALMAHAARRFACQPGSTRADGSVSLEPVYCLGLCSSGPSAMVDEQLRGRVSAATVDAWAARNPPEAMSPGPGPPPEGPVRAAWSAAMSARRTHLDPARCRGRWPLGAGRGRRRAGRRRRRSAASPLDLVRNGSPARLAVGTGAAARGRDAGRPRGLRAGAGRGRRRARGPGPARRLHRAHRPARGARRASAAPGPHRSAAVFREAAAHHVRPRRPRRPAVAGRLRRARRLGRPRQGARDGAGGGRRRGARIRPARPRRRRVPGRHQVEDGGRHGGPAQGHRLQRRRGRLGHVLRPDADGGRSIRARRRHGDRAGVGVVGATYWA